MAYLVVEPIALTPTNIAAASYSVTLSTLGMTLVDDDWLILSVICAATSGTLSTVSSGWSEIAELDVGLGNRMARYKVKVAGGTAADPQIDLSAGTGQWSGTLEQWRDADATDCIDSSAVSAGASANVSTEVTGALTPGTNDCAISYFSASRNSSLSAIRFKSDEIVGRVIQTADAGSVFRSIALGTVQQTTAAATAKTLYAERAARLGQITIAIKTKVSGGIDRDCRAGVEKMAWMGTFGTTHESLTTTYGEPSTFVTWTGGTINGITADNTAPTVDNDTSGAGREWGAFSRISSAVNTAGAIVGGWIALPATIDLTGKFVSLEWFLTLLSTQLGPDGLLLALGDNATASTGNAVVYQLAPKTAIGRNILNTSVIDPATATTYDTEGSINLATINKVGFFYHRVGSSATARTIQFRNLMAIANSIMTGGSSGKPLDIRFLDAALNGWGFTGLCDKQGDAVLVKTDVQFGDGTIPTYVDTTATLLNTPSAYSTGLQPFWNAAANSITVGMKAASGDTMNFVASAMAAGTGAEQSFTIDAATSATALAYSFQGEVISNFLFTGDTDVPIVGATFSGCDEVAFGGADVTSVTISGTTSADAACSFDANGVVVTSSTIDGTGGLYAIELGTAVTAITLTDCTITAGSTDKVHVLATTGTVTITISGTTSLILSEVTTDGATVSIVAPTPTLDATVLSGTRVVLYNNTTAAELDNTAPAGTAWSKVITGGASSNDNLTLFAFKEGYAEFSTSFLYSGADTTILVTQVVDDVVAAFRTEDSITDYTTLTEYNIYAPTIYIQADDADGVSKISRLATYYNGILTTEDGARYFRGGMSMISTGAVRINKGTIELLLENVSATKSLRFSDEATRRLYTDDGTSIIAPSSVAGSIEYAYGGVPDTVETGVSGLTGPESAQLMALTNAPSAIDNADALLLRDWTAVVGAVPARSALNALRWLRNKWFIVAGVLTVTKEDDTTTAWTAAMTSDAAADNITGGDPT